jgi:putative membrane protein
MSADRTLMSAIRTALSLIGFGFAIHLFFTKLLQPETPPARGFATTLVLVGIVMLGLGIYYHIRFMLGLRAARTEMTADGLIHGQGVFPPSLVLVTALLLLLTGLGAVISIVFQIGPFG